MSHANIQGNRITKEDKMEQFDIPVVLILFKRKDTVLKIISQLEKVKPQKIYLLSDDGRNEEEKLLVSDVRKTVENAITWECEVIKNYADGNRGVYANIGLGARWVFEREKMAIFLEDDNYPEITFFRYCKEMLIKYQNEPRVLWVCGTNYLGQYFNKQKESYMFTQHLLPCGWASWADKFLKFYDGGLVTFNDKKKIENFRNSYSSKALYNQQLESVKREFERQKSGKFGSWDYQMLYSLRANNLFGISPSKNQIRNIGVDDNSIHGGSSLNITMTRRFCENPIYPLDFPFEEPEKIYVDSTYDKKIGKIILLPLSLRIKGKINKILKKILHIDANASLINEIKKRKKIKWK